MGDEQQTTANIHRGIDMKNEMMQRLMSPIPLCIIISIIIFVPAILVRILTRSTTDYYITALSIALLMLSIIGLCTSIKTEHR
jgi:hypothetical protein